MGFEIRFLVIFRVLFFKKPVIDTDFSFNGMPCRDPVQGSLYLASVRRRAAPGLRVIRAVHLDHFTGLFIFDHAFACDKIGKAQSHLAARGQTEEFFWRVFKKVISFNVDFSAKRNLPGAHVRVLGVVQGIHFLHQVLGIVVNNKF